MTSSSPIFVSFDAQQNLSIHLKLHGPTRQKGSGQSSQTDTSPAAVKIRPDKRVFHKNKLAPFKNKLILVSYLKTGLV